MALRLAVVVSQSPGLGGTPSVGHRSTAVVNASAAASSAMSRSPNRLVREATTRGHWTFAGADASPPLREGCLRWQGPRMADREPPPLHFQFIPDRRPS